MEVSKPITVTNTHNCPTHGNYEVQTLYVLDRPIRSSLECPECKILRLQTEAQKAQNMAKREEEGRLRDKKQTLFNTANVPYRYADASLRSYKASSAKQRDILARLTKYCENWFEYRDKGTSLMLLGSPGTGKTHLACSIIFEITHKLCPAQYTTVADFSRAVRATYASGVKETETDALNRFADYQLLVIDEIGSSSGSDHEKQTLFDLINRRYNAVAPTILLSNLLLEEVREFLGARIMDRLREGGGKVFVLDWESYRK